MVRAREFAGDGVRYVAAFVVVAILSPLVAAGVVLATNLFLPLPAMIPAPERPRRSSSARCTTSTAT